jgi:hypothetical protein
MRVQLRPRAGPLKFTSWLNPSMRLWIGSRTRTRMKQAISSLSFKSYESISAEVTINLPFPDTFPSAFFYNIIVGKNDPHIRVLSGFKGVEWDKICGKIQLNLKGLTSQ